MSTTALDATLPQLEARLAHPPGAGSFDEGELQGLPDPVCRYFRTSIAAGTPLARSAHFGMRGSVKFGRWWIPFRARQVYAPQHGLVWTARAGGVVSGFDRYAAGQGAMQWTLRPNPAAPRPGTRRVPQRGRPGRRRGRGCPRQCCRGSA